MKLTYITYDGKTLTRCPFERPFIGSVKCEKCDYFKEKTDDYVDCNRADDFQQMIDKLKFKPNKD